MAQPLGRIERPTAEQFSGKRKLLLVPLLYGSQVEEEEAQAIVHKYWEQVQSHVASLDLALGGLKHVYHESLSEGGEPGLSRIELLDKECHAFVRSRCQAGAVLEVTESADLLTETMDLQRCLMLPFASEKVARQLQEWLTESVKSRYQHVADRINETLGENELGLLIIGERHQVQFPNDIEVFYVSPPALDEFRRWVQDWITRQQALAQEREAGATQEQPEEYQANGADEEASSGDAEGDPPADETPD